MAKQEVNEGMMGELMASMKHQGLLQPIGVRKIGNHYKAVYGHRRLMAAKNSASTIKMRSAGNMIAKGTPIKEALEKVDYIQTVSLCLTMKVATINRLQAEYGIKIHDILYNILASHEEFGIVPIRNARLKNSKEFVTKFKVRRAQR